MPVVVMNSQQMQEVVRKGLEGGSPDDLKLAHDVLTQAIIKQPDNFWLWFWLGGVKHRMGDPLGGIAAIEYAPKTDRFARVADAYNNIGSIWRRINVGSKATEAFEKAVALKPYDPDILNNLGTLHVNEGSPAEGEKVLRRAIEVDPGRPHPHWNLSLCLLEQQQWAEGFYQYVWGLVTKDRPSKPYIDRRGHLVPWWHGERVSTLVVYGEQGVGDETMFMSMIPDMRLFCDRLIIDAHPRLVGAYRRSFAADPGIIVYDTRKVYGESPEWAGEYEIDAKAPLATCAKYLRYDESLFRATSHGYLKPDPALVAEAEKLVPGTGPLIGLTWVGGVTQTRKDLRAIPLKRMVSLLESVPDARFVSLQYTDHAANCAELEKETGIKVHVFPEWTVTSHERWYDVLRNGEKVAQFNEKDEAKAYGAQLKDAKVDVVEHRGPAFDLDRMLALMSATDAIVTVNQSCVWFGGALGHPTFCLTPSKAAWRYGLERPDTAWFSSIRQYRQVGDDWQPAFDACAQDLQEFLCRDQQARRLKVVGG